MFLRGSAFDTDPQYPALGKVLRSSDDQMQRAEQIHEASCDYFERVSGPNAINARQALRDLLNFARKPLTLPKNDFVGGILEEMARIFPQKVAYVREEGLTALILEGQAEAQKYGLPTIRGEALLVVLMFAFGHGCTDDPLYPWISRTLRDARIADAAVGPAPGEESSNLA